MTTALAPRRALAALLFAALGAPALAAAAPAAAQQPASTAPAAASGTDSSSHPLRRVDLDRRIELLMKDPEGVRLSGSDRVVNGGERIAAGARVTGPVIVSNGTLDVYGIVDGDAIALDGDVVVHEGGTVTGSAVSVGGQVRLDGGRVDGEMRSLSSILAPTVAGATAGSPLAATWRAVQIALGSFGILVLIAIGVLVFGEENLSGVVETMQQRFARSFWIGVAGQFGILPLLVAGIVALAITIVGVVLIPVFAVAYALAVAGILTLGFLAAARVTGAALARGRRVGATERSATLRALLLGLALYMGLWLLAALFTWQPVIGMILRVLAVAAVWAAATSGLGAVLLSRAGTRHAAAPLAPAPAAPADELAWQTPTPIGGVAAARRPTPPVSSSAEGR